MGVDLDRIRRHHIDIKYLDRVRVLDNPVLENPLVRLDYETTIRENKDAQQRFFAFLGLERYEEAYDLYSSGAVSAFSLRESSIKSIEKFASKFRERVGEVEGQKFRWDVMKEKGHWMQFKEMVREVEEFGKRLGHPSTIHTRLHREIDHLPSYLR